MINLNKIKKQHIKNYLSLYRLIKIAEGQVGFVFYTDTLKCKNQLNKKTTLSYLFTLNILNTLGPSVKCPNFYYTFESFYEIPQTINANALFIKVDQVFCCSQKLGVKFLISGTLSSIFNRIFLSQNIYLQLFSVLGFTDFEMYVFN